MMLMTVEVLNGRLTDYVQLSRSSIDIGEHGHLNMPSCYTMRIQEA